MFCFGSALYWTEIKKFVYNNQQCFAFQITYITAWKFKLPAWGSDSKKKGTTGGLKFKPKYTFAFWSKMNLWFVFIISLNQAQFIKSTTLNIFITNWSCSTTNLIFSSQKQFWTNSANSKMTLKMNNLQFLDCFFQNKCQSSLKF